MDLRSSTTKNIPLLSKLVARRLNPFHISRSTTSQRTHPSPCEPDWQPRGKTLASAKLSRPTPRCALTDTSSRAWWCAGAGRPALRSSHRCAEAADAAASCDPPNRISPCSSQRLHHFAMTHHDFSIGGRSRLEMSLRRPLDRYQPLGGRQTCRACAIEPHHATTHCYIQNA